MNGAHLLDADTLIEAKNRLYAFDLCPGFWAFLEHESNGGTIRSIARVRAQLEAGADELAAWARGPGSVLFLPDTAEMHASMTDVANWVQAHPTYSDGAKRDFLANTDAFLVAFALGHQGTVVTNEQPAPDAVKRVKIPDVCDGVKVPHITLAEVLRLRRAEFTWAPPRALP